MLAWAMNKLSCTWWKFYSQHSSANVTDFCLFTYSFLYCNYFNEDFKTFLSPWRRLHSTPFSGVDTSLYFPQSVFRSDASIYSLMNSTSSETAEELVLLLFMKPFSPAEILTLKNNVKSRASDKFFYTPNWPCSNMYWKKMEWTINKIPGPTFRMATIKQRNKHDNSNSSQGCRATGTLIHCWW